MKRQRGTNRPLTGSANIFGGQRMGSQVAASRPGPHLQMPRTATCPGALQLVTTPFSHASSGGQAVKLASTVAVQGDAVKSPAGAALQRAQPMSARGWHAATLK
jgi:hypothetical protein